MLGRIVRSSLAVPQTLSLGGVAEPPFFSLTTAMFHCTANVPKAHMFFMMVTWDFWLQDSGHVASLQALGHAHLLELKTVPFKDLTLALCFNTVVMLLPV